MFLKQVFSFPAAQEVTMTVGGSCGICWQVLKNFAFFFSNICHGICMICNKLVYARKLQIYWSKNVPQPSKIFPCVFSTLRAQNPELGRLSRGPSAVRICQHYTTKTHQRTTHHTIPHQNTPHNTTPLHTTPHHTTTHHTTTTIMNIINWIMSLSNVMYRQI